jgi:alpha-glucosidase
VPGWWENAVVYQVYPRSFQDSDGDGIGDLAGIRDRLSHLAWLGVDAVWISPIYPSPLADYGYDVADYTAVASEYGTLADFDSLLAEAHERGIRVVLDLVPSHTSIEHPWFREHPDRYVWADGPEPPNNWVASFGGPAWSRDPVSGRLYLHSFFPEQPDLDWRNPDTRAAMAEVIRFWLARGVDGFRVDAVDRMVKSAELLDEPPATEPPELPAHPDAAGLGQVHSRDDPEIDLALATLREAAGEAPLFGEVYLSAPRLARYARRLDSVFAFDLLHAAWDAEALALALERSGAAGTVSWVTSNHDFPRVATRWGERNARAAAVLLLTLGGTAFVYQGEEIGMVDGAGGDPPRDRFGRDGFRQPMQWAPDSLGGFTDGEPWLPMVDPGKRNVTDQREDPDSIMSLFRTLIELRRGIAGPPERAEAPDGALAFRRGDHLVTINAGPRPVPLRRGGEVLLASERRAVGEDGALAPGCALVQRTR